MAKDTKVGVSIVGDASDLNRAMKETNRIINDSLKQISKAGADVQTRIAPKTPTGAYMRWYNSSGPRERAPASSRNSTQAPSTTGPKIVDSAQKNSGDAAGFAEWQAKMNASRKGNRSRLAVDPEQFAKDEAKREAAEAEAKANKGKKPPKPPAPPKPPKPPKDTLPPADGGEPAKGFTVIKEKAAALWVEVAKGAVVAKVFEKAFSLSFTVIRAGLNELNDMWEHGVTSETAVKHYRNVTGEGEKFKKTLSDIKQLSSVQFSTSTLLDVASELEVITLGAMNSREGIKLIADAAAATDPTKINQVAQAIGEIYQAAQQNNTEGIESQIEELRRLGIVSAKTREEYFKLIRTGADGGQIWRMLNAEISKHAGAASKLPTTYAGLREALKTQFSNVFADITKPLQAQIKPLYQEFLKTLDEVKPVLTDLANWFAGKLANISTQVSSLIRQAREKIEWLKAAMNLEDTVGNPLAWDLFKAYALQAVETFTMALISSGVYAAKIVGLAMQKASDPKYGKGLTQSYNPVRTVMDWAMASSLDVQANKAKENYNSGKIDINQLNTEMQRIQGLNDKYRLDKDAMSFDLESAVRDGMKEMGGINFISPGQTDNDRRIQGLLERIKAEAEKHRKQDAEHSGNEPSISVDDPKGSEVTYQRDMNRIGLGTIIADSLQSVGGGGNSSGFNAMDQQLAESKKQTSYLKTLAENAFNSQEFKDTFGGGLVKDLFGPGDSPNDRMTRNSDLGRTGYVPWDSSSNPFKAAFAEAFGPISGLFKGSPAGGVGMPAAVSPVINTPQGAAPGLFSGGNGNPYGGTDTSLGVLQSIDGTLKSILTEMKSTKPQGNTSTGFSIRTSR